MYSFIKEAHKFIGIAVLLILLMVITIVLINFLRKKPFGRSSKITSLTGLIVVHLQLALGLIVYFISPFGVHNFSGEAMGNKISRFYLVEHPIGMIVAAALITIGFKRAKKTRFSDAQKHKQILIFYVIGLAIISYLIPWFIWF